MKTPDEELLADYDLRQSEDAFSALVRRHATMVFATALRQVGDARLAEEVTQNTFVTLARKAPRLRGHSTVAGWLHRVALLEAKACLRRELRRRRREEVAADLAIIRREGNSPMADLVPFLDEALMELRDQDRQALILRFLEGCTLREVGKTLGIAEDAARKRVSRALDRVSTFFRERGFASGGATPVIAASVLSEASAQAAPPLLVSQTLQGVASALAIQPSFTLSAFHIMALNKTKAITAVLLLSAAPLAWQWRARTNVEQQYEAVQARALVLSNSLRETEAEIHLTRDRMRLAEASRINAEMTLADRESQQAQAPPPRRYRWDDDVPWARVPKSYVAQLPLQSVVDYRGGIHPNMIHALQMTEEEAQRVQDAIDRFLQRYDRLQDDSMKMVAPEESELDGQSPESLRVFEVPYDAEAMQSIRESLFSDLRHPLGNERFAIFQKGLGDWMALDERNQNLNSGMAVMSTDFRWSFFKPEPGANSIRWKIHVPGSGTLGMSMELPWIEQNLPPHLLRRLRDWVALAAPIPDVTGNESIAELP